MIDSQYLNKYAEAEVTLLKDVPSFSAESVCVVPCYQESDAFIHRYRQTFSGHLSLLIVVLNQPSSQQDTEPQMALQESLLSCGKLRWQYRHLSLLHLDGLHVLLVDRFSTEQLRIPEKKGVGLARKIGADCASYLIAKGCITQPWIYSTDADAHLPCNYFDITPVMQTAVAVTFDFAHQTGNGDLVAKATKLYEQRLHYYVDGLRQAGSGYAFHTIGSCLAIHATAYQKVRGFPQKAAGEDFYLLNKLAKLGPIASHPACIALDARISHRVPFGTGPAVAEIVSLLENQQEYCVYHPQSFVCLQQLLIHLNKVPELATSVNQWCSQLPKIAVSYLEESGFFTALSKWQRQKISCKQLQHQVNGWMDAFRTLKFIHYCRDSGLEDLPLADALTLRNKK
ncbi:MAG: hypothetical protein ACFHVJ_06320 [Aestuariibacter sp.]